VFVFLLFGSQLVYIFQSTQLSVRFSDTERSFIDQPVVGGHRQVSPGSFEAKDNILFEAHNVSAGQAIVVGHREESTEAVEAKESNLVVAPNESTPSQEEGVSACLLIMDDNHFLIEWLAYHFHALPLRRLIVAVDPRSQTSPTAILDRYRDRGLINITEWTDTDFMDFDLIRKRDTRVYDSKNRTKTLTDWHRQRQKFFNVACLRRLKEEKRRWTLMVDTDEYLLPNQNAKKDFRIRNTANKTIYEMLQARDGPKGKDEQISQGCIPLPRLRFGVKESNETETQRYAPGGLNGTDFVSVRYRYRVVWHNMTLNRLGKAMVDVSRVPLGMLQHGPHNGDPHQPVIRLCTDRYRKSPVSPFVLHHYVGTFDQFFYRDDSRPHARSNEVYEAFRGDEHAEVEDDSMRPWLKEFVASAGHELASALLADVGVLKAKAKGSSESSSTSYNMSLTKPRQ
jgi:hypothetical protein